MGMLIKEHDQYPESILVRNFVDSVDFDEILSSWEHLVTSELITPDIKGIINDLSGCELNLDLENFAILTDFLKKQDKLRLIRLAVIADSPDKMIFPMLGDLKLKEFEIQPFSSMEPATRWLLNR
jgi:hypothetical protein